jgi:hypothetical protein
MCRSLPSPRPPNSTLMAAQLDLLNNITCGSYPATTRSGEPLVRREALRSTFNIFDCTSSEARHQGVEIVDRRLNAFTSLGQTTPICRDTGRMVARRSDQWSVVEYLQRRRYTRTGRASLGGSIASTALAFARPGLWTSSSDRRCLWRKSRADWP